MRLSDHWNRKPKAIDSERCYLISDKVYGYSLEIN